MIPYIIFIILILAFYYKKSPIGMLIVIIAFSVLRYDTGWDYMMYVDTVNNPKFWNNPEHSRYSFIWRELFRYAHALNFPHIAIALPNLVTYLVLYFSLDVLGLDKTRKVQVLFVYVTWQGFYLDSFSIIRQAIAMSFGILTFALIQRHRLFASIVSFLIAVHLHSSAVVLIFLYLGYFYRKKLDFKHICIAAGVAIVCMISAGAVLEQLSFFDMSKYDVYLKMNDSFGSKIIFVYLILAMYLLFVYRSYKKWNDIERQCFFYSVVSMVGCVGVFSVGVSSVFTRIFSYYIIFMIFILLPSLRIFRERKFLINLAVLILVSYFFVYLSISEAGTKLSSSGLVPYKCVLIQ